MSEALNCSFLRQLIPALTSVYYRYLALHAIEISGNNLMTCASKLKVDRGIPGEPILYLSGKYQM